MSLGIKRLFSVIFILWLSLLPLIFWNGTYEGIKVLIFTGGGFFLTVYWLVNLFHGKLSFSKSDYLYWLWLAILFLASTTGIHPLQSIIGGDYRHQGVLFFLTLWLTGKTIVVLNNKEKNLLRNLILVAVTIESFLVISDYYLGFSNWKVYGFKGPLGMLGEPNATAGFVVLGLYLLGTLSFPRRRESRFYLPKKNCIPDQVGDDIFRIFMFIISGFTLLILRSLSSIIIFIEYITFIFLKKYQQNLLKLFFLAIIPVMFFAAFYQTKSIDIGQSLETRPVIWQYSLQEIIKRPVLGYGAETTTTVFDKLFAEKKIVNTTLSIDRSHNLILDLLMWSGVAGAVAFLAWLTTSIVAFIKSKNWFRIAGIIGWLTFASVQPLSVVHWVMLMVLING